ncbi:MAG: dTDP-4-dehydrorhamnose 3,5-epimerase [Apibacter sp.]|uniref:dTDP-4-dehydrorhamnose 3,5-epimerase n=1 Tax=Apibacter mensalis TaxID=1586267 RepID=A0A0X3ALN4_9FLAO|nr:dTDP-4-dehydrorhamnose 3,5-epimerase [Apibacter mensalis]MCO6564712.1 dTDP-4-dehydrorhamnose 3,5-epimerase [Apibacter sp.]CVK15290.1 dTDP-4-dehydrorhamnose 3,5-epimerase [Apibacter mensalis]
MIVNETKLKGCYILEPKVFEDSRGFFMETFNFEKFEKKVGYKPNFVQDNVSKSSYGVIRGLHQQSPPYSQAKLVYVLQGNVIDVAVDARKNSPTFGQYVSVDLSSRNRKQLFIPKGFLHGFSVISDTVIFAYKCEGFYNKESELNVNPLDKDLNIDWGIRNDDRILSEKDLNAISFKELEPIEL